MLRRTLMTVVFLCSIFCLPVIADSKDDEIAKLSEQVKQLRAENQALRIQLANGQSQNKSQTANTARTYTPVVKDSSSTSSQDQEQACWLTTSSNKRHNSSCQYYKQSKGRPCSKNEGIPCKVCGG